MNNYLLFTVSMALFVTGIFFYGSRKVVLASVISTLFLLYSLFFVVCDVITGKGVDSSVIYHLQYGLEGAGLGQYLSLILFGFAAILFASIVPYVFFKRNVPLYQQNTKRSVWIFYSAMLVAFLCSPTTYGVAHYYRAGQGFAGKPGSPVHFDEYYRQPSIKENQEQHPNLVVIYAESLEETFFDQELFPGLMKELQALRVEHTYFSGIKEVEGTSWTIAGITATQCGIPLVTPSNGNSMSGMDLFLAGAVCLGDLLENEGYLLSLLRGASLRFAGTGKLFSTHGFKELQGLRKLQNRLADKSYLNEWGLYDDSLFDLAIEKFHELSQQKKPFGLFMETIDTHFPEGDPSASCKGILYNDGNNPMLNAVACSDYLIADFVKKIVATKYAQNTVIVILSDHLAMRNTASDILSKGDRRGLFLVIAPGGDSAVIDKTGSTLDVAPTVLSFLGYDAEVGLGRNLLKDETSLVAQFDDFDAVLKGWRKPLSSFWRFPRLNRNDRIMINSRFKTVTVQGRVFRYPILIELQPDMEVVMRFNFGHSRGDKLISDYRESLDKGSPFLWVDRCSLMANKYISAIDDYCLEYGVVGLRYSRFATVRNGVSLSVNHLLEEELRRN